MPLSSPGCRRSAVRQEEEGHVAGQAADALLVADEQAAEDRRAARALARHHEVAAPAQERRLVQGQEGRAECRAEPGGGWNALPSAATTAIVRKKFQCTPYSPTCSW